MSSIFVLGELAAGWLEPEITPRHRIIHVADHEPARRRAVTGGLSMDDSTPFATRNAIGRVLSLLAVVVMVIGAFLPIFDRPIARGGQILAMIAAATAAAAVIAPLGSRFALTFLWAAFGMACAIGIIGIFSIGFVYWIAAALLLAAIFTTPNRSGLELRYDWRYIAAFFVGFLMLFLSVVI